MIPELTIRTRLGAVDLLPFLRRDEGQEGVELREWERRPAALVLDERGWSPERIAHATGLRVFEVAEVLNGTAPIEESDEPEPRAPEDIRRVRAAERVMRDGRWYHQGAPHGTASGYKHWGCRCGPCSDAKKAARPPAAKVPVGRHYEHGTYYSYQQGRCRCEPCKEAGRAFRQGRLADLRAGRVEVDGRLVHEKAPHGTLNGYNSYGCRCEPCFEVQAEANRKRRQKVALVARIRTLKPTRFTSRSLAKCPRDARTTFEGMWCEADDHGRGIADARLLKGAIWPLDDDITFLHVSSFVDVLAATGHIRLYAVDGEAYYEVTNWEKHQAAAYRRGEAKYPPFSAGQPLESLSAYESVQESAAGTQTSAGTGNREQGTGSRDSTAASPAVSGGATIFDETPLADFVDAEAEDEDTSKEVAVPGEITAGTIVASLIDVCRQRSIHLPDKIIKRFGKEIKEQLKDYEPALIWRALSLMSHENVLDSPELLPKKIVAVQSGPRKFPTTVRTSATDEAVAGWLALADQFPEGVAA